MKTNYKQLNRNAKRKLNALVCKLYGNQSIKKCFIDQEGIVHLVKREFLWGLFKSEIKKNIHDLLNIDLPRDISSIKFGSTDFIEDIKDSIITTLEKLKDNSELIKIEYIIDLLYTIVFGIKEESMLLNELNHISNKPLFLPEENNEMYITCNPVKENVEEPADLLFIFNSLFRTRQPNMRRTVRLCTLFIAFNAFIVLGRAPIYESLIGHNSYIKLTATPIKTLYDTS